MAEHGEPDGDRTAKEARAKPTGRSFDSLYKVFLLAVSPLS